MNNKPGAAELLAIARQAFAEEISPSLPEGQRYTALMIANAMAIARREIEAGDAVAKRELESLCTLLGATGPEPHARELDAAVAALNRKLIHNIRSGHYDNNHVALLAHLRKVTEAKLAISNPKLLDAK
jgi:uncharacterized protein DUF6285